MKKDDHKSRPPLKVIPVVPSVRSHIALTLVGIGYILTSLSQMTALGDYSHYHYLFQQYPDVSIQIRFSLSWIVRMGGLILGIGLLSKKEIFRKLTLGLALGTMAVAYWKHPYEAFARHIQYLNEQMTPTAMGAIFSPKMATELISAFGPAHFSEADFIRICVYAIVAWEIFCAAVVLFVLTRPKVKAFFR